MKRYLAAIAFVIGLLGVGMAAFQNNFIQEPPVAPPEAPKGLKAVAAEATRKLIEDKILHKEPARKAQFPADPVRRPLHPYQVISTALGVLAIGVGTLAWSQRNHIRLSGAAIALGIMAVAWQWVMIAVVVAVVILILSMLSAGWISVELG